MLQSLVVVAAAAAVADDMGVGACYVHWSIPPSLRPKAAQRFEGPIGGRRRHSSLAEVRELLTRKHWREGT